MKLLVTGASGFIGTNFVGKAAAVGHDIVTFDLRTQHDMAGPMRHYTIDLTDPATFKRALSEKFDACVHLAGQTLIRTSLEDPAMDLSANVSSVINLLLAFSFDRFIYISTGSVYEGRHGKVDPELPCSPAIPYAISKYTGELYVRSFAKLLNNPKKYLILRLFNPYGPHEHPARFISRVTRQFAIKRERELSINGSGKALMDPMYVDDCTSAIMKALESKTSGQALDICWARPMTVVEVAEKIAFACNIVPKITCSGKSAEEMDFSGDPVPQEKVLGFKPVIPLKDGVARYVEFIKRQA